MNFFKSTFKKTTDSIAAHFHTMVAELEVVEARSVESAKQHAQLAEAALASQAAHLQESVKASRLAAKIKELLS